MTTYKGKCVCGALKYSVTLDSPDDARTSLCHCHNCRHAFGTNFGLTTKVPVTSMKYEQNEPKLFKTEHNVCREFCDTCGTYICEYGEQQGRQWRYVVWGTFDDPESFPPKGEFLGKYRAEWMPEIQGVFHISESHH